jgi:hypothetical protein
LPVEVFTAHVNSIPFEDRNMDLIRDETALERALARTNQKNSDTEDNPYSDYIASE